MPDLHVIATIPVRPDAVGAMRPALQALVAATRSEDGCLAYDLYESASAPGTFVTVERWTDQGSLDAHLSSPHVAEAMAGAADALSGEIAIHPLGPVDVA